MSLPGHQSQEERPIDIDDGTSARTASRSPSGLVYLPDESISTELSDAPRMCVPTSLNVISLAEMRVLAWLREHSQEIIAAERRFSVDRRAIAGVIAWEALKNVRTLNWRGTGPGKSHQWDFKPFPLVTTDTLVAQVETAGKLPKQSVHTRGNLLMTANGAITYIAAAMDIASSMAEQHGFDTIRNRPEVLSYFWNSKDLRTWEKHLKAKKRGERFVPQTDMALWILQNTQYLEDAVGKPDLSTLKAK